MTTLQQLQKALEEKDNLSRQILISNFSNRRTCQLEDLTDAEMQEMYLYFFPQPITTEEHNAYLIEEMQKKEWKSNVITLAEKTGIKEKDDWRAFNHWMRFSSRFKKHLNAHSIDELKLLYKQLKGVELNNAISAQNPLTKAWYRKGMELKNMN